MIECVHDSMILNNNNPKFYLAQILSLVINCHGGGKERRSCGRIGDEPAARQSEGCFLGIICASGVI